jgi:hypothetical protein
MATAVEGLARKLAQALEGIEEGMQRARAAARALGRMEPEDAARVISAFVRRAGEPAPREIAAIAAVGEALLDEQSGLAYETRAAIYAAAALEGLHEVTDLFIAPAAQRRFDEPFDKADPRLAHLTLGHKKVFARSHRDPDLLARLAAEGEPRVVRELLANPRLTEPFVVRIAARRPCRPETLRFSPTELVLKILPQLSVIELAEIGEDGNLHQTVRASAKRLTGARRAAKKKTEKKG